VSGALSPTEKLAKHHDVSAFACGEESLDLLLMKDIRASR
jgi:hypothetical protein